MILPRRLRGVLGTALVWSGGWAVGLTALGLLLWALNPSPSPMRQDPSFLREFLRGSFIRGAIAGAMAGAIFAGLVCVTAQRARRYRFTWGHAVVFGALGGVGFSALLLGTVIASGLSVQGVAPGAILIPPLLGALLGASYGYAASGMTKDASANTTHVWVVNVRTLPRSARAQPRASGRRPTRCRSRISAPNLLTVLGADERTEVAASPLWLERARSSTFSSSVASRTDPTHGADMTNSSARRPTCTTAWLAGLLLCSMPLRAQAPVEAAARVSLRSVTNAGVDSGKVLLALTITGQSETAQPTFRLDQLVLRDEQGRRYAPQGVAHRARGKALFMLPAANVGAASEVVAEREYLFLVPAGGQRYELLLPRVNPVSVQVTYTMFAR